MSKKAFVSYAGRGFWAYDVALGVFVKYLLDAAQESRDANLPWLSEAMASWRVWAVISDFGFTLDEHWSAEQKKTFMALVEHACNALASRKSIPAEEIVSWPFVNDLRIFPGGEKEVLTGPVAERGRAMVALVRNDLPDAPKGRGLALRNTDWSHHYLKWKLRGTGDGRW